MGVGEYNVSGIDLTREQAAGIEGPFAPDYIIAIGSGHMMANGSVKVFVDGNGNMQYEAKINYTFWDTYGWDKTSADIPHTIMGVLGHQEAIRLEQIGAKPFKARAYFSTQFFGTKQFKPILYNNASNTLGFPDQTNRNSIEGEQLINDFR